MSVCEFVCEFVNFAVIEMLRHLKTGEKGNSEGNSDHYFVASQLPYSNQLHCRRLCQNLCILHATMPCICNSDLISLCTGASSLRSHKIACFARNIIDFWTFSGQTTYIQPTLQQLIYIDKQLTAIYD